MQFNKQYILTLSLGVNLLLIGLLALHWQLISLKYTWRYTPSLPCDILRMSYAQRFEHEFKSVDAYFAAHPDGDNMPTEIGNLLRKMEAVQTNGNKIQKICEDKIIN